MAGSEAGTQTLLRCPHCNEAHQDSALICPATGRPLALEGRLLDGKFRLIKQLGEGGMGTVWKAENVLVRRLVAIKLLHAEHARNESALARFRNEATAAGRIGNPHICDILDFGISPIGPFLVMELLQGRNLGELVQLSTRLEPALAVMITRQALVGLEAAHRVGIVHRDLKPENIFLHEPEPGRLLVKLMDFGISKFAESTSEHRTRTGVLMGTPEFMSPEQTEGAANVDARTDVWAMGLILYHCITGVHPFRGPTMAATLMNIALKQPPPVDQLLPVPRGLAEVVQRTLEKRPEDRFATALALSQALQPFERVSEGEAAAVPSPSARHSWSAEFSEAKPEAGTWAGGTQLVAQVPPGQAPVMTQWTQGAPATSTIPATPSTPSWSDAPQGAHSAPTSAGSWAMGSVPTANEARSRTRRGSGIAIALVLVLVSIGATVWFMRQHPVGDGTGAQTDASTTTVAATAAVTAASTSDGNAGAGATMTGAASSTSFGTTLSGTSTATSADAGSTGQSAASAGAETTGSASTSTTGASSSNTDASTSSAGEGPDSADPPEPEPEPKTDPKPKPKPPPPPPPPAVDLSKVLRSGTIYTVKQALPATTHAQAIERCARLRRTKFANLGAWRLATPAEVKRFKGQASRLLYWTSAHGGGQATTVNLGFGDGKEQSQAVDKAGPRPFCVSSGG